MNRRVYLIGALFVFTVLVQNYLSQVSALSNAQIAALSLHDWVRVVLNFLLASAITLKAYLTPSSPSPEVKP